MRSQKYQCHIDSSENKKLSQIFRYTFVIIIKESIQVSRFFIGHHQPKNTTLVILVLVKNYLELSDALSNMKKISREIRAWERENIDRLSEYLAWNFEERRDASLSCKSNRLLSDNAIVWTGPVKKITQPRVSRGVTFTRSLKGNFWARPARFSSLLSVLQYP